MDQWLEDLRPDLRALARAMRQIADESRQAWLRDRSASNAGRDTPKEDGEQ